MVSKAERELRKTEPAIEKSYMEAVAGIVAAAKIKDIIAAIGSLPQLMDIIGFDGGSLSEVHETVRAAYKTGGTFEAPAARIKFNMQADRAEDWLKKHSSAFVTRITDQQREAIRITVAAGTEAGRGPRQTALDIVGRVGANGKRTGGIVGLTDQQAQFVANARVQLRSGDPAQMRDYLTRTRRDRRFDGIVQRAIKDGKPVAQADTDRIASRYADRLLQTRGNAISRTEALQGFSAGREQAWQQAIDAGVVDQDAITKVWDATGDARVRDDHRLMDGTQVKKNEPFVMPDGSRLMFPGDTSLGASAGEIINCRCVARYTVDHFQQ